MAHNGLRGIAALLIVAYHLQYRVGHLWIEDATTFLARSYLMVDLFFVLSGFIMAYVQAIDRSSEMTKSEVRDFWFKRFVRIYPMHFVVLVAMIAFNVVLTVYSMVGGPDNSGPWTQPSLTMLAAQFVLLNAWLGAPNNWNIPSWSISAEFVAYAFFPGIVLCLAKAPRAATATMLAGAFAFYVIGAAGRSLDITGGVGAPLRCMAGFCLGMIIYGRRRAFQSLNDRHLSVAQIFTVTWIGIVIALPSHDALVIPAFAALVGLTCGDRGVIARALGSRTLLWLGEISYAVYIAHLLILYVLNFWWDRTLRRMITDPSAERVAYIVVAFLCVIIGAHLSNRLIERPLRDRLMALRPMR